MSDVRVVFRKYDGALHWHVSGNRLGDDGHGSWVGFPKRTIARRGVETRVEWPQPAVMLIPEGVWWTAFFMADPHPYAIYCNIASVPEWDAEGVTMVDLDLDVIRYRDGRVVLEDIDEVREHQVHYSYPRDVVTNAESAAQGLLDAVRASTGPFGGAHDRWLTEVRS